MIILIYMMNKMITLLRWMICLMNQLTIEYSDNPTTADDMLNNRIEYGDNPATADDIVDKQI